MPPTPRLATASAIRPVRASASNSNSEKARESAGRFGRAVDPAGRAARVMLLLPDRHTRFRLVDDIAARVECGPAVIGADAHPNRAVAYRELADAMLAKHRRDGELRERLR